MLISMHYMISTTKYYHHKISVSLMGNFTLNTRSGACEK